MALYYRDNNTMGHPEKLDDDDMCLADYGVQDGGEILMEDAGQRASEDNDAAASSSSAAGDHGAETMEAIRKAREAEVRAVANAAADAASAVPYVSTIR